MNPIVIFLDQIFGDERHVVMYLLMCRTKLKQTEVDCEFLKRCCEKLSNENRRLKKELRDLRSVKLPTPPPSFYLQFQRRAAEFTAVCPSGEMAGPSSLKSEGGLDGAKPKLLIGSLPNTSMAC